MKHIGPTRALRLTLEQHGEVDKPTLYKRMLERGVGLARADRALRRAVTHGQVRESAPGRFQVAREGAW